jgi:hypothetical protein
MRHPVPLTLLGLALTLAGCGVGRQASPNAEARPPIRIELNVSEPTRSFGMLSRGGERRVFPVGYGRNGVSCAGRRFEEGYTPLGRFRVNAILSGDRFAMDPALIARSGKTETELRRTLFRNMNAIDFDGDGQRGEYGSGYVSLEPVGGGPRPAAVCVQHLCRPVPLVQLRDPRQQQRQPHRPAGDRRLRERERTGAEDPARRGAAGRSGGDRRQGPLHALRPAARAAVGWRSGERWWCRLSSSDTSCPACSAILL